MNILMTTEMVKKEVLIKYNLRVSVRNLNIYLHYLYDKRKLQSSIPWIWKGQTLYNIVLCIIFANRVFRVLVGYLSSAVRVENMRCIYRDTIIHWYLPISDKVPQHHQHNKDQIGISEKTNTRRKIQVNFNMW